MIVIILDLDNCISDDGWRVETIDWHRDGHDRFHRYHSLAPWDSYAPHPDVAHWVTSGERIAIFTARPVMYRHLTEEWLRRKSVEYTYLLMRNQSDLRPSLELKRSQLQWLVSHYDVRLDDIGMAYDDRPEIVAMYREAGLQAEVRAIHNKAYFGKEPSRV